MNDPDAIWKPGYDGPPPVVEAPRIHVDERPHANTDPDERPSLQDPDPSHPSPPAVDRTDSGEDHQRWRWFGVAVAVGIATTLGLVAVAAVVVLDRDDATQTIEPPDRSIFGGPSARRIPDIAATLWSADIAHEGDHWVDVVGRDLVVAAYAAPATNLDPPDTTLVALDALTGEQRWTTQFEADDPRDVTLIGAVDGVLVLEHPGELGRTATGVDAATGATRWTDDAAASDGYVGLVGTPFVARLSSRSDRSVAMIDAVSGRDVGTIASDPPAADRLGGWSTDRRGTWFVIDDGEIVAYDLRTELGEPTVIGSVDGASSQRVVVDGRFVTLDEAGSVTFVGSGDPVVVSDDIPGSARTLTPASGSTFVVNAPRSITGVSVEGDTADPTWMRGDGEVVADHPVEGGTLLQVATRGGAAMQLVDGVTGQTVEHLTMAPGALQALEVVGDGFVALHSSELGTTLTGFDLDGTRRWSILDATPVVVGDRVMVRATSTDVDDDGSSGSSQQLRITAYGDIE